MRSYKYNTPKGEIKIRFYQTGCFTFTDPKGYEHEKGQWWKQRMYLDEQAGILSKDKNAVYFEIAEYGHRRATYSTMKNMADNYANIFYRQLS